MMDEHSDQEDGDLFMSVTNEFPEPSPLDHYGVPDPLDPGALTAQEPEEEGIFTTYPSNDPVEEQHDLDINEEDNRALMVSEDSDSDDKGDSDFVITVGEYTKHEEGKMKSFVSYTINVKTSHPQYKNSEFSAERRYNDFYWLHEQLEKRFKGFIIPPMPEKTVFQNRFDTQFIEDRRRDLEIFVKEVALHPVLSSSDILQNFLEADVDAFEETKIQKPQAGRVSNMFSWVTNTVAYTIQAPVEIDPFFAEKTEYLNNLSTQLTNLLTVSNAIVAHSKALIMSHFDMSVGCKQVSAVEEGIDDTLKQHWIKLSDVYENTRLLEQESTTDQEQFFEDIIKYYLRLIQAALTALSNRSAALGEFQAAENRLEALKERRAKPGFKHNKNSDQQLEDFIKKVEETKEEYEMITESLKGELERFEKKKQKEITTSLRQYAKSSMDMSVQVADGWKKLLNQIQSV